MTHYETLLAYGIPPEQAARDAHANEIVRFGNREHPAYGQYDPDPPSPQEVREAFQFKYEA